MCKHKSSLVYTQNNLLFIHKISCARTTVLCCPGPSVPVFPGQRANPRKSHPTLIHLKTHICYQLNCQFYCLVAPLGALLLIPCAITTRAPLLAWLLLPCGITTRSTEGLLPRPPTRATISGGAALCSHRLSQGSGPGVWG